MGPHIWLVTCNVQELGGWTIATKTLRLNPAAFVLPQDYVDDGSDKRIVVDDEADPIFVELTRLAFPEEAAAKAQAPSSGSSVQDFGNPWAQAPPALIRAAAKHLFL